MLFLKKYHKKKITATETKMIIDVMIAIYVELNPVVVIGFVS